MEMENQRKEVNRRMEMENQSKRKQMKEDIIKLFISNHRSSLSSSSAPNPSSKLTPRMEKLKTLMKDRLPSMFTAHHIVPTHPPYAVMIREAIKNLKGRGECTNMKSISNYITTNFEGLPWAASQFLKHYLQKLVDSGEISFASANSSYHLREEEVDRRPNPNPSSTRHMKDMVVPVSRPAAGSEETVIDVKPLQKQMSEINPIEESAVQKEKLHGSVGHPIAEKTLLVYHRRKKGSTPLVTSSTEIQKQDCKMLEAPATVAVYYRRRRRSRPLVVTSSFGTQKQDCKVLELPATVAVYYRRGRKSRPSQDNKMFEPPAAVAGADGTGRSSAIMIH